MAISRERLYELQARHRHRNFPRMVEYLRAHPCSDCGEPDLVMLEFDHLPGTDKKFDISRAVGASTRSWRAILTEIEKCEVVCANCHRRRTANRAGFRRHLLDAGDDVPDPVVDPPEDRRFVPHGGGAKGRRDCPCEPCRTRRRDYTRELRARKRAADRTDGSPRSAP
ncbi:hypothetical protein [Microbacterium sp. Root53]|uniref:hypothetical protein n=1 Tax=Microbacterium sp. Root53 TaxID=1736553 RepID=UPI00106FC631|nr:hypothetical protein [Microbacterium sp. Root53]